MVLGVSGTGGIPGTPLCPGDSGEGRDSSGGTGMGESQGVLCVLGTQDPSVCVLGTHNQRMGGTVRCEHW